MTNKALSASEIVLMKVIWDHEADISMPELLNILKEDYGKDYARTTVVTFLPVPEGVCPYGYARGGMRIRRGLQFF